MNLLKQAIANGYYEKAWTGMVSWPSMAGISYAALRDGVLTRDEERAVRRFVAHNYDFFTYNAALEAQSFFAWAPYYRPARPCGKPAQGPQNCNPRIGEPNDGPYVPELPLHPSLKHVPFDPTNPSEEDR